MSNFAVRANNLSKQFLIQRKQNNDMLRDQILELARSGKNFLVNKKQKKQRRNTIWALKDVSFEIMHGESIGIIGANGAGKTTLLKILARVTAPSEGKVRLRGRIGSLLEVGTGFHSELTGRENVYLNGAILGMHKNEIDRKFDEIVDFSGVENFIDTPVKRYSTGMRMRLAFSVAAHLDSEILLIDEVLAVGDLAFQTKSLSKMESVARDGRTVLFVSHNLAAVKAFCNNSMLLENGILTYMGDTEKAIQMYVEKGITLDSSIEVEVNHALNAQILKCYLCDKNGEPASSFPHSNQIYIRLKIHQKENLYKPHLLIRVLSTNFDPIFVSRDFEETGEFHLPSEAGTYEFQAAIPANFLSPGKYYLEAEIAGQRKMSRSRTFYRLDQPVEFDVYDNGSLLSQFNLPWKGWVHADVKWQRL